MTALTWESRSPQATNGVLKEAVALPRIFWGRPQFWQDLVGNLDDMASHPTTWDTLASFVTALKPTVIVEAGTYRGHATLAMAEALHLERIPGRIATADVNDFGVKEVVAFAGLSEHVVCYHGLFETMLARIPEPIDLAFIDASDPDNSRQRLDHLEAVWPRLRMGGVALVDDATNDAWEYAKTLRDTCDVYLPVGMGIAVYQKGDERCPTR